MNTKRDVHSIWETYNFEDITIIMESTCTNFLSDVDAIIHI